MASAEVAEPTKELEEQKDQEQQKLTEEQMLKKKFVKGWMICADKRMHVYARGHTIHNENKNDKTKMIKQKQPNEHLHALQMGTQPPTSNSSKTILQVFYNNTTGIHTRTHTEPSCFVSHDYFLRMYNTIVSRPWLYEYVHFLFTLTKTTIKKTLVSTQTNNDWYQPRAHAVRCARDRFLRQSMLCVMLYRNVTLGQISTPP